MSEKKDKLPTMTDVARKAGVSRQLVSLVLSNSPGPSQKTRELVLQTVKELNYHPHMAARMLRSKHSRMIGVVYTIHQSFHSEIIEKLYPIAQERGYGLILSAVTDTHDYEQALNELISFRSEGIVIMESQVPAAKWREIDQQVPVVMIGRADIHSTIDYVESNDEFGVFQAVDHLVALGHRYIAFLSGGEDETSCIRREAYLQRMCYHDLQENVMIFPGQGTEESGLRASQFVLNAVIQPTGIIASNDRAAIGLMHTLRQNGLRVPEDISIVGYDDTRHAKLSYINLTTVRQDTDILADAAMKLLWERLSGQRQSKRSIVYPPELIVRGSTAKCKHN